MSPIRAENRDRYPANWKSISAWIRFSRALGRCECEGECGRGTHEGRCPNRHGQPAYGTGSKVVLTVAHLVSATQLPVDLHVTRTAYADEIVELVGLLVPFNTEGLEGNHVMHDRALAEFLAGPSASDARFVVALPGGATCGLPRGSVVAEMAAIPERVVLSSWRLSGKPGQAADVPAEPASRVQVIPRDAVLASAALACPDSERPLRATYEFSATGVRASADVIRSLLRRDRNHVVTNGALDTALTPAPRASDAGALDAFVDSRTESPFALGGTSLSGFLGVVREFDSAYDTGQMSGAKSRSGHSQFYHLGYLPENCDPDNLKAMCNGCHLHYDRDHHAQTAARTRAALATAGMEPLFETTGKAAS